MPIKCCLGCPDRKIVNGVRCHSWCERYAEAVARETELRAKYRLQNLNRKYVGDIVAYKKDQAAKYHKRRGH